MKITTTVNGYLLEPDTDREDEALRFLVLALEHTYATPRAASGASPHHGWLRVRTKRKSLLSKCAGFDFGESPTPPDFSLA
jgi:hypothetical protein